MPPMDTPIGTLDEAKTWLGSLTPNGSVDVGSTLFSPPLVQRVFTVIPGAPTLSLTSIAIDLDAVTLTGIATVLEEPLCTVTLAFTADVDDPLLLTLTVARPNSASWTPIPSFSNFALGNLVATITPVPLVPAVTMGYGCTLFAGTAQFDAMLTLAAVKGGDWTLRIAEQKQHPFSADLLTTLTGSSQSGSVLPSSFPLDQFHLNEFEISFNPQARTCSGLKLGLEYDPQPPWQPFGDHFKITAFVFAFEGHFGKKGTDYQAVATAKTQIGPVPVDVTVQFPDQAITIYLDDSKTLSVPETFQAFGVTLPSGFPDIQISTLSLGFYVLARRVDFNLGIDKPFAISGSVDFDKFAFSLALTYASNKFTAEGHLYAAFSIQPTPSALPVRTTPGALASDAPPKPITLTFTGDFNSNGSFSLAAAAGNIPLGNLIAGLLRKFGIDPSVIPEPIRDLQIKKVKASFDRTVGGDAKDTFKFYCDAITTIAGAQAEIIPQLTIVYSETDKTWSVKFEGKLILTTKNNDQKLTFDVTFSTTPTDTFFTAKFTADNPIGFGDIAGIFGFQLPEVPTDLDLNLKQITFRYDTGGPNGRSSMFFGAASTNLNYGNVSYISLAQSSVGHAFGAEAPQAVTRQNVFILAANRTLSLSDLPLVGPELAKLGQVALEKIEAAIAVPAPIDKATAATLNAAIDQADPEKTYPRVPTEGLTGTILLAADFQLGGGTPKPISISLGGGSNAPAGGTALVAAGAGAGLTQWFNIQKTFGPVSIQKVGVRYSDGFLYALMNASLQTGPVQLGLLGLGAGSPLNTFSPKFTVDGVTISVKAGPMAFSGALVGKIDPVDLYGEIGLSLPSFSIGALGGYADYQGHPSCFLFATLDAELGGPPFFFVTGLAAGFGLNRTLVIPPVDSLNKFPLIAWATGTGPNSDAGGDTTNKVLTAITELADSGVIAPSIGEYWLAAGIKFSSFQLIDSFALLTIKFGNQFEIDLLGLSTLTLPPKDPVNPVALAELALVASFMPDRGLIAVSGQLTSRSFLLSRDCHLTGGFAFYMWYAHEHAGEFVLTLGGYSPRFKPPPYYPNVPRLGLNWRVTDNLSVSGDEYFALTASAVMAGGGLRASWSSGSISAWFAVEADFLLIFRPLHYYISASIDLGASVDIDLWFTSFTLTVHLGVGGEFWGPPFGYSIYVDLGIVSFTIGSGSEHVPDPISWDTFVTQMLPARNPGANAQADADDPQKAPVLQINGVTGVVQTLKPDPEAAFPLDWLVNGDTLQIGVVTTIPIIAAPVLISENLTTLQPDPNDHSTWDQSIAVGPSAIDSNDFTSTLTVTAWGNEDTTFDATRIIGPVPRAIWEVRPLEHGVPSVNPMADTVIPNALTGLSIVPVTPTPQQTLPIPIEYLRYTTMGSRIELPYSVPSIFTVDPFTNETVHATIAMPIPTGNRAAMIAAINRVPGFSVPVTVDVSALADAQSGSLLAPPMLRYLVEAK